MTKRMLIDATNAEETRVVVLDGNRLEDFDVETQAKRQLKGNIYLAKVVRVEPSLQAAFIEYGGGRHGFLAFGEIHPDYYQIPIADRQRLLAMQAEEARAEEARADEAGADEGQPEDDDDEPASAVTHTEHAPDFTPHGWPDVGIAADASAETSPDTDAVDSSVDDVAEPPRTPGPTRQTVEPDDATLLFAASEADMPPPAGIERATETAEAAPSVVEPAPSADETPDETPNGAPHGAPDGVPDGMPDGMPDGALTETPERAQAAARSYETVYAPTAPVEPAADGAQHPEWAGEDVLAPGESASDLATETAFAGETGADPAADMPPPESIGGDDATEDARERRAAPKFLRNYKIQEVIRRRQILLVQVVKEERGTKGAALTTYISLAGRYCVLMPNSPRGGGISRKITSAADRRRLKEITAELEIPDGMGLIVRTAGANRPKPEIRRDCEYLLRLWDDIREHTMRSTAPALIYEEANLIKRAIRDVYARDVEDVIVDGEAGWQAARSFMSMLVPTHARKVQLYRDGGMPLFAKHQVDAQIDAMLSPTVQLKSGGYLVINQTEALVAIDVNSGRSTRERNIEETALRTNLEASDEVARQLRLRDLAGLIVIDFIDMESKKHNAMVERRLKEALKDDRARIQVGHISHFGLLEMSRQRLRPSLAETAFVACTHCNGTGLVRGIESAAIHVLRHVEEEGAKRRAAEIVVHVATAIALYLLNNKRERLRDIEARYGMRVTFAGDDALIPPEVRIERVRAQTPRDEAAPIAMTAAPVHSAPVHAAPVHAAPAAGSNEEDSSDAIEAVAETTDADDEEADDVGEDAADTTMVANGAAETADEGDRRRKRRRRRRRGGRREEGGPAQAEADIPAMAGAASSPLADPDADHGFHIEGVPEQAAGGDDPAETPGDGAADAAQDARRRRGRRGGRRRARPEDGSVPPIAQPGAEQPDLMPRYVGPTPADPFGQHGFDIFDVIDQVHERQGPLVTPPEADPFTPPEAERDMPALIEAAEPPRRVDHREISDPRAEPASPASSGQEEPSPEEPAPPEARTAPAIQPVLVSADLPAPERRRGWWRR